MPDSVRQRSGVHITRPPSYAAQAALLALGEAPSTHSAVVCDLAQIAIRQHGLNPQAGQLLRSLFDRRSQADHGLTSVPETEGERGAVDAEQVVTIIEVWLVTLA
jgi:uncharacterized protein (UPF0332 family)